MERVWKFVLAAWDFIAAASILAIFVLVAARFTFWALGGNFVVDQQAAFTALGLAMLCVIITRLRKKMEQ